MQQQLTLSNGLRVRLISDPTASRAAALMQLAAGSHHEPANWPGLAHLLEHLVFAGGENFQQDARLMSWAQAQGARLNATTGATSTAWFFDISAPLLEPGVARLTDMLARPLLAQQAIAQEAAVIDAEYQLLSDHAASRREAALSAAFASPAALQAFHTGNLAHFGDDAAALQQALRQYHQRYFHAANLTLWLQGPQPLSELAQLASRYASDFSADGDRAEKPDALILHTDRHFALQALDTPRLLLTFPLSAADNNRQSLTLLRQFIEDKAPGSLLAALSERGYCDNLQLLLPYSSENGSLLCIEFLLSSGEPSLPGQVEALFFSWLQQLREVTAAQRSHYSGLAAQQFSHLTPVDQLRARAFGFSPLTQSEIGWQPLLAQLTERNITRLWSAPAVQADRCYLQGYALPLTASHWPPCGDTGYPHWRFYPQINPDLLPVLPLQHCPLTHFQPDHCDAVLIVAPAPGSVLPSRWGHIMQASLQAISSHCAHTGGQLNVECPEGQWLLQFSGPPTVILSSLAAALRQLNPIPAPLQAQGERQYAQQQQQFQSDIAVRCLLNQLPQMMAGAEQSSASLPLLSWNAALYGGDSDLRQGLARLLTRWPGEVNLADNRAVAPQPLQTEYRLPTAGQDAAVVLFCPLTEQSAGCLAAWRMLAALFAPRFFQQLRVEKNLGYAVSCRFTRIAGQSGLLFAVQSPTCDATSIFAHISGFIADMAQTVFDSAAIAEQRRVLADTLLTPPADQAQACREQWLSQQSYPPALSAEAISRLTPAAVAGYCQQLNLQRQRWWHLTNSTMGSVVHKMPPAL